MKHIFTLAGVSLALASCDPPGDDRFWITNPTADSIYYYEAYERHPLPELSPFRPYDEKGFYPYERRNFMLGTGKWDGVITLNSPRDSTLRFYIFKKKTIETTPWTTIRQEKLYRLYLLKLDELRKENWKITLGNNHLAHDPALW